MNDTIVAISTALGVGAISIIRVSGNEAVEKVNQIFRGKNLNSVLSHTIHYGHIIDDQGNDVDEVLVSVMKAPKTFTCEDVVEINCHGGIAATQKVLECVFNVGVRLAEPGEFSKRAFLNGRIDLTQAEAIIDIINGKNELALKGAMQQLNGELFAFIRTLRDKISNLLVAIQVNIDYPEYEDIEVVTKNQVLESVNEIKNKLIELIQQSKNVKMIKDGIDVLIIGRPNVGKSSILNKLLQEEKAIVTDIAGTTRDVVEGKMQIDGIQLNILDTAGIRKTEDIVENIGVNKAKSLISPADLILCVLDGTKNLEEDDKDILNLTKGKNSIIVINKTDLPLQLDLSLLDNRKYIFVNTIENNGLDLLKQEIKMMFNVDKIIGKDYNYFSNARQLSLAKSAFDALNDVETALSNDIPLDIVELEIKKVWDTLGEITGDVYTDELIDKLFSQFCLGK